MIDTENSNIVKENAENKRFGSNVVKDVVKENPRENRLYRIVNLMEKNKEITIDMLFKELLIIQEQYNEI